MKCVVLFGGRGTRVSRLSKGSNKALIDVLGKPIAFYVLKNLLSNFKEIQIVTNPEDVPLFESLCKQHFPTEDISIVSQESPEGVPHGILQSSSFIKNEEFFALCLGDFFSTEINQVLRTFLKNPAPYITLNEVKEPWKYGILNTTTGKIEEKPKEFIGSLASRGFYILPGKCLEIIPTLTKSHRNELEMVDLLNQINFQSTKIEQVIDLGSEEGIRSFAAYLSSNPNH